MKMTLRSYDLRLTHTFKIAHDERDIQRTLIVELEDGGFYGYGEATESKYYNHSIRKITNALEANRQTIEGYLLKDPTQFWEDMSPLFEHESFAQCALDLAANDLYGKIIGKPLHKIWGLDPSTIPNTNYTIGIDSIDKMVEKLQEFPWPMYKIKLGTSEDLEIIRELRKHTDAVFRVDANCAWSVDETIKNSVELEKLNVEFIEQPLSAVNWDGMKEVFEKSTLPVIADESCINEDSIGHCHGHFHGVNIKLMKCGGLTPAQRMIKNAKSLGMKAMIGCMTESSVGISAISQLLPMLDYVDMDGSALISNDLAEGPKLENGEIVMPNGNGTGVVFKAG